MERLKARLRMPDQVMDKPRIRQRCPKSKKAVRGRYPSAVPLCWRVHISKYITNVNIVGADVSVGAAGHVGVNDTSQASVAAVQRFLRF